MSCLRNWPTTLKKMATRGSDNMTSDKNSMQPQPTVVETRPKELHTRDYNVVMRTMYILQGFNLADIDSVLCNYAGKQIEPVGVFEQHEYEIKCRLLHADTKILQEIPFFEFGYKITHDNGHKEEVFWLGSRVMLPPV